VVDATTAWAVVRQGAFPTTGARVVVTDDAGQTWETVLPIAGADIYQAWIDFTDANRGWYGWSLPCGLSAPDSLCGTEDSAVRGTRHTWRA
jgi:hypothetical protein